MKRKNVYFICHLTDIFIRCMFFTGKMAFDGHDTRQIFALFASSCVKQMIVLRMMLEMGEMVMIG